jgi:hypothetical protein
MASENIVNRPTQNTIDEAWEAMTGTRIDPNDPPYTGPPQQLSPYSTNPEEVLHHQRLSGTPLGSYHGNIIGHNPTDYGPYQQGNIEIYPAPNYGMVQMFDAEPPRDF